MFGSAFLGMLHDPYQQTALPGEKNGQEGNPQSSCWTSSSAGLTLTDSALSSRNNERREGPFQTPLSRPRENNSSVQCARTTHMTLRKLERRSCSNQRHSQSRRHCMTVKVASIKIGWTEASVVLFRTLHLYRRVGSGYAGIQILMPVSCSRVFLLRTRAPQRHCHHSPHSL